MTSRSVPTAWIALFVLSLIKPAEGRSKPNEYTYDQPDKTIEATLLRNPDLYDADIVADDKGLWITWLEFVPGVGDHLWFGCRSGSEWTGAPAPPSMRK